jgi:2-methylcitrate dehydratase PrpD
VNAPERIDPTRSEGVTADLTRICLQARGTEIPPHCIRLAQQCLLDWLSVAIAGSPETGPAILRTVLQGEAAGAPASIVGGAHRASERDAALINGTMGHALDFDDVNLRMHGHPTAPIAPALLAIGEVENLPGDTVLRAFIGAYQVAGRLGAAMGETHYAGGFHATATVGAVAAAAGCAIALNLDAAETETALGLAATQGAGLKAMFGTMAKPFHAGRAAEAGVLSARLAAAGFTARAGSIDHPQGFGAALSDDYDPARPGPEWEIERNLFKYHAACYLTHSTIEAIGDLRRREPVDPGDVERIELHVPASHRSVCDVLEPASGLDVKFSIRHLAAMALCGMDTADLGLYSAEIARDARLSRLRARVEICPADAGRYGARVAVRTRSGTLHEAEWDVSQPENDLDRQEEKLRAKSRAIVDPVLGQGASDRLWFAVAALADGGSARALMAAGQGGTA